MMKKRYPAILLIIIICAVMLCGCSAIFKEPTVNVGGIELTSINLTEIGLDVTLNINNPNPFGVTLQKITADVSYQKGDEWKPISHIVKENVEIAPGENSVVIPVSIKNVDLIKAGFEMVMSQEITIQVSGIAEPSFFGISPKIPFTETQTIPLKL